MLYCSPKDREKLMEAIKGEARDLDIVLVMHDLDRSYVYYSHNYNNLDSLVKDIIENIRSQFHGNNFSIKEICITTHTTPWNSELIRIQTRCKR